MSEIIPIVNQQDKVIGYKNRNKITKRTKDIYRVSALWLVNSQEEILLAQRKFNKMHNPGKWGPAVSGTVAKNEDYLKNIIKETKEEIGLNLGKCLNCKNIEKTQNLIKKIKQSNVSQKKDRYDFWQIDKLYSSVNWLFFCQWYFLKADIELEKFTIQPQELEQLKWIARKEFEIDLKNHPKKYITTMIQDYKYLKKYQ